MVATLKDKITKKIKDILYIVTVHQPRGSIVLALWIRWASSAFLKESRPFFKFFNRNQKHMIFGMMTG